MKFKMIHHVNQQTIDKMYHEYSPVFILSTGRAGSKFLAALLNRAPNVTAYHEPPPTLEYFSDYAFHHQEEKEILSKMIDAARMESILEVFIKDKIYVESNQCMTFFAPVIAGLFKKSKFVHVVRHPGDFVRSAIRKGWHKNDSIWESGRVKMADQNQWNQLDHIEKLSWLWDIANGFIENFFEKIEKKRTALFKIEDLFSSVDRVKTLFKFIGGEEISTEHIAAIQKSRFNEMVIHSNEPPNMKKTAYFPGYQEWNDEMKNKLAGIVKDTSSRYGYVL